MAKRVDILVLGGGASGFFAAISAATHNPQAHVLLAEKSKNFLSKVKVSGGGRCNVTCGEDDPKILTAFYPRGGRMLSRLFYEFGPQNVKEWFSSRGVKLKTESDGRVFPVSNSSQTIIECLVNEARKLRIETETGIDVVRLEQSETGLVAHIRNGDFIFAQKVIVATGGAPKIEHLVWLKELGHEIVSPLPSLYTFNSPGNPLCKLMGVSVSDAIVRIAATKFEYAGPLLITHWGVSGPAVLKLSAFAARDLAEINYQFTALINFTGKSFDGFRNELRKTLSDNPKKQIDNLRPKEIPSSLWTFLLNHSGIDSITPAIQIGKKQENRLVEACCSFQLPVNGKTTFKEEFVTTGGVSLNAIDQKTMESKSVKGLFFAGEVLDIDGITGGYNFQAAWTTGYFSGKNASKP